jgi:hypothetical protein
MAMQSRSAVLRQEIESSLASRIPAALSPQAVQAPRLLPIGNDAVNTLIGGGPPIGGICEFTGPASAGRTSLALSVLSEATVDSACAYIDVSDSLDARSAAAAGVRLQNLLWVRFSDAQEQRTNPARPGQSVMPSRDHTADRSTQHHGIRHPRTETKGTSFYPRLMSFAHSKRNKAASRGLVQFLVVLFDRLIFCGLGENLLFLIHILCNRRRIGRGFEEAEGLRRLRLGNLGGLHGRS